MYHGIYSCEVGLLWALRFVLRELSQVNWVPQQAEVGI